jgi:hypothetical protein
VVVRLSIVEASIQVAGGLPMGSFGLWWHVVVEAVDGFHTLVVGIGGVGF